MPDYVCPRCRGGFNDPVGDNERNQRRCPWCGQALDRSYDYKGPVMATTVERDDDSDAVGVLGLLRRVFT